MASWAAIQVAVLSRPAKMARVILSQTFLTSACQRVSRCRCGHLSPRREMSGQSRQLPLRLQRLPRSRGGILIQEISGIQVNADGSVATSSFTGGAQPASPGYSSTAVNEFLVTLFGDDSGVGSVGTVTFTGPAGYTVDAASQQGVFNGSCTAVAYKNSANGSESALWTYSETGSGNDGGVALVAFKAVPGGGQGSVTQFDQPQIIPGPTWLDLFKHKQLPFLGQQAIATTSVSSTGSFALAPLAFNALGTQTSPDVPQISPGTTWLRLFKQYIPKPAPVPPAFQSANATGSFALAPIAFAAQGNQTSPDIPQAQPGPAWFRRFKPGLYKPVPPVPAYQAVSGTGSFNLAPVAFSGGR